MTPVTGGIVGALAGAVVGGAIGAALGRSVAVGALLGAAGGGVAGAALAPKAAAALDSAGGGAPPAICALTLDPSGAAQTVTVETGTVTTICPPSGGTIGSSGTPLATNVATASVDTVGNQVSVVPVGTGSTTMTIGWTTAAGAQVTNAVTVIVSSPGS